MEKLINYLAQSLIERQISNNLQDLYFKKKPEKNEDWISVATVIARILEESFISNGYRDVYPYAVFYVEFTNEIVNIHETAWLIGVKGQSIEWDNQLVEESDDFLEKMVEIEHHLYDQYMPSDNQFLPPVFEYKRTFMKRTQGFDEEFGRSLDSAFILRIPIDNDV